MPGKVNRVTVDLAGYPDLVVIYLGMRVNSPRGLKTVLQFGPRISSAVAEKPEGLLLHESLFFSLFPLHVGMRQYWQDFDALEAWARSMPHQKWWQDFWNRSWIHVAGTGDAAKVSQGYAMQRWMLAGSSRGEQPAKFNGGLFTVGRRAIPCVGSVAPGLGVRDALRYDGAHVRDLREAPRRRRA